MTREEAVKLLQATRLMLMDGANQPISDLYYALDMAIEALEQTEPSLSDKPTSSEKPNNCEHITEDGVTCAKYPACDDCLDNPLNKVKGSEKLLKGMTEPTISKMEQVDKDINVRSKDCETCKWGEWYRQGYDITMMSDECGGCCSWNNKWKPKDEPQTEEQCETCRHKDECEGATYEYKNTDWWCLGYAPIDESQTDCPWK